MDKGMLDAVRRRKGFEPMPDSPTPAVCGNDIVPHGWWCSRKKGHEGPCAAHPADCANCGWPMGEHDPERGYCLHGGHGEDATSYEPKQPVDAELRRQQAHVLAMLGLQSDRYVQDAEYRDAVDNILSWSFPHLSGAR